MTDVGGLSAAFVEAHPADAARVLESLAPADTAEFVAALALRLAGPILRDVSPSYCARTFELLEDAKIAALTQKMGPQSAARALEQLAPERQLKVLSLLPVALSIAIRLLIGYPRGTCGACMDPWTLVFAAEMPADEALDQVRKFDGEIGDSLFVTNGERRLIGIVPLSALLRAGPREPLSALMCPPRHTVSALASAGVMLTHPAWDDYHVLPVVERENRLVGALRRRALVAALEESAPVRQPGMTGGLFDVYWEMLEALSGAVVGALPPVTPVAKERSRDGH